MLEDGQYPDFTIRCEGCRWPVHRTVISAHSKYFATLCSSKFKVDLTHLLHPSCLIYTDCSSKEAAEQEATLHGETPDEIHQLLHFMYTRRVLKSEEDLENSLMLSNEERSEEHKAALVDYIRSYVVADKYSVPAFSEALKAEFAIKLNRIAACMIGDADNCHYMAEVVENLYASTPDPERGLRAPLALFFVRCQEKMMGRASTRLLIDTIPEFKSDIFEAFLEYVPGGYTFWCPRCCCFGEADKHGRCLRGHKPVDDFPHVEGGKAGKGKSKVDEGGSDDVDHNTDSL